MTLPILVRIIQSKGWIHFLWRRHSGYRSLGIDLCDEYFVPCNVSLTSQDFDQWKNSIHKFEHCDWSKSGDIRPTLHETNYKLVKLISSKLTMLLDERNFVCHKWLHWADLFLLTSASVIVEFYFALYTMKNTLIKFIRVIIKTNIHF